MSLRINPFEGEDHLLTSSAAAEDDPNAREVWGSSRSSSTLIEDAVSLMGHNGSQASSELIESSPSAESDLGPAAQSHGRLRPLYAANRQSTPEEGSHQAADMKLTLRSRKGHRKSRQGCFNCKRRKIKCQESFPACDNCLRKDLLCKYPPMKSKSQLQASATEIRGPLLSGQLQTTPIFSLVDMRLFHHFVFYAYPHLPVGNDAVWVGRVPAVAYHYEYLMHALLGLAASHLTVTADADYSAVALSHRLLAIKGFNEALSKTPRSGADGDALLAACYALTFQSSYMKDGMSEFLTMVRGCGLVSLQLRNENVDVSFSINPTRHIEIMESRLDDLPSVDADLHQGAAASFHKIAPLCTGLEAHMIFQKVLEDCVETAGGDSRSGYFKFVTIYHVLGKMDNQQFQMFSNPCNDISRLLLAHFMTVEVVLAPILGREWQGRMLSIPMEGIFDWLDMIYKQLAPEMRGYLDWPLSVAAIIKTEMSGARPPRPWLKAFFRNRAPMVVPMMAESYQDIQAPFFR